MKRTTILLVGLFGLLLLIAYLVLQKPGEKSSGSESAGVLVVLDSVAVDKISIKSPASFSWVVLEKHGVEWFLEQPIHYRADQNYVATVLGQIKHLETHGIVSSNPEKQSVFQVDSTGILVTIFEHGTEKASFIVGKPTSSFTETYTRKLPSNDVVAVEGSLGFTFNRQLKDWRDRTVFTTSRESINSNSNEVKYQFGDTTFVLSRKDSVWMVGRDSTDQNAVSTLLDALANIQADDFIDSLGGVGPKLTAQISFNGVQLYFSYDKNTKKYRIQTSQSPQWFVLESSKAGSLLKRKKDLVRKRT